jgi:hypothetical protein
MSVFGQDGVIFRSPCNADDGGMLVHGWTGISTVFARRNGMVHRKEWRCVRCGKLLGLLTGERLHIRYERGNEYFATLPVTATCRRCGTLNEKSPLAAARN